MGIPPDFSSSLMEGKTSAVPLAMGTNKITGVGDPADAQDAATKAYVDTASGGNAILMALVFGG